MNPSYSREFLYGDNIVKLINANEKIGSIGDLSNIRKWQKYISDKYYTKLINANCKLMFEFDRNKEFFENFLNTKLDIVKPIIHLKPKRLNFELPKKYVVLFIGASAVFRKWDIEKFAKVGKYLKDTYGYEVVLCGAPTDREDAIEFSKYFKDHYVDLVGKTSLLELLYVIYNGNHFGRFIPYPKEITESYHPIYHPKIEKNLDDYKKLTNNYGYGSILNISEINTNNVIT